ncbi:hypothetical protein, partial [Kitasatospora indigofera]|uniref:hypothetical protein n=1 Tax=Kitasatospora indigofera TaxID=67307 RepID=UPI0036A0EDC4
AIVGAGASLGSRAHLAPHAVVGVGSRLGNRVTIGASARVGVGARLGDDETVPAGAVIPGLSPAAPSGARAEHLGLAA